MGEHVGHHISLQSLPNFIGFEDLQDSCSQKIKTAKNEVTKQLETIKSSPEKQAKRKLTELELQKIHQSRDYLKNYIEKYYEELSNNWLTLSRPYESRLEKILEEIKKIEENFES